MADTNQRIIFADFLLASFESKPVASQSKSELELLIFAGLVNSKILSLTSSDFDIGRKLVIPASRVASLRYRYRLNHQKNETEFGAFVNEILFLGFSDQSGLLKLAIEDAFYRDMFASELRKTGTVPDTSFNKSIIQVDPELARKCIENMAGANAEEMAKLITQGIKKRKASNFALAAATFIASTTSATLANFIAS